jgi:beta-glucanase (GH16 family)
VAAPLGAVLAVLLPLVLVVGLSGPARTPTLPSGSKDALATTPAPTCGALDKLSSLLGACPGATQATDASLDTPATTIDAAAKCSLLQDLLGQCKTSTGASLLLLALALELHNHWPTTTTSSSTTSTSSTTTTSSSTTTTTTTTVPDDCTGTSPPVDAPSGDWACTFDDEFNGTSLDTTKWQPQLTATSGYTTGTAPNQVCYVDNPSTIREADGYLDLSVIRDTTPAVCAGADGEDAVTGWEGGTVSSYQLFSQEYGYFQVRAELPASSVRGLQETLWLYPENETLYGPHPDSGEIDYGEFYSDQSTLDFPAVHYPGSSNDPNAYNSSGCGITGTSAAGQFNTYALMWTPTTITAYFNGVPCITDTYAPYVTSPDVAPEPFTQPFFLAFTAAVGIGVNNPTTSTPARATTELDWVRVWQYGS